MKKRGIALFMAGIMLISPITGIRVKAETKEISASLNKENAPEVSLDKEYMVPYTGGENEYLKFTTPNINGYMEVFFKNVSIANVVDRLNTASIVFGVYSKYGEEVYVLPFVYNSEQTFRMKIVPNETYYMVVRPQFYSKETGNYKVKVGIVEDKDGDTKDEASKISINKTITSRIESYGDIDYFSFVAGDNKDYSLTFKNLNMEYNGLSCQVLSKYDEVIGEGFVGYDQTQTLDLKNLVNGETYYIRTTSNSSGNYKIKVEPACKSLKDAGAVVTVKSKVKYNGKAQTPSVTIKVNNIKLKKGVDYRVKYTNNKKIGKATVKITGIGKFKGTITKTFEIVK